MIDHVQRAVDPEADVPLLLRARLDMDIAGALLKGVLQQPVDDGDDMAVVGVGRLGDAHLHQPADVGDHAELVATRLVTGAHDRAAEVVVLVQVTADVLRVRQHPHDLFLLGAAELFHPVRDVRLAADDRDRLVGDGDRQDLVPRGVGVGHDAGHGVHVDLEWIDALVGNARLPRQPDGQGLRGQRLVRRPGVLEPLVSDHDQRVQPYVRLGPGLALAVRHELGVLRGEQPVRDEVGQNIRKLKPAPLPSVRHLLERSRRALQGHESFPPLFLPPRRMPDGHPSAGILSHPFLSCHFRPSYHTAPGRPRCPAHPDRRESRTLPGVSRRRHRV